jgi:hypothetical protein
VCNKRYAVLAPSVQNKKSYDSSQITLIFLCIVQFLRAVNYFGYLGMFLRASHILITAVKEETTK